MIEILIQILTRNIDGSGLPANEVVQALQQLASLYREKVPSVSKDDLLAIAESEERIVRLNTLPRQLVEELFMSYFPNGKPAVMFHSDLIFFVNAALANDRHKRGL